MSGAPLVRARGLSVAYRRGGRLLPALADIDLEVGKGTRLAVIGESGSGKSTLAMAMAGLLPAEAQASGVIDYPALGRAPRAGADIGVVFQDPGGSLDPVVPVGAQVAEVAAVHLGLDRRAAWDHAVRLLDRVAIPDAARRARAYPHEFSGGQRQRIALAAALAGRPLALVADEPTSALDTVVQREIVGLIDRLVAEDGLTLILVTHDIALASERADTIAVLYAGRLVEAGPAAAVLAAPRHPYTRALIATHLDIDAPRPRRLPEIPGAPPDPAHLPEGCPFRPRCPLALHACLEPPPWVGEAGDGAACWRADEAAGP